MYVVPIFLLVSLEKRAPLVSVDDHQMPCPFCRHRIDVFRSITKFQLRFILKGSADTWFLHYISKSKFWFMRTSMYKNAMLFKR